MKSKIFALLAVLLAAALLFAGLVPALAAQSGSLTLNITDDEDAPVADFEVRLVRVADSSAKLVGAFKAANIAPEELKKDKNNAQNAKTLLSYARNVSAHKRSTDADGEVLFENLGKGIYLVYDPGEQGYVFDPFLVMVPTTISGTELYDIVASPKVEPEEPDDPTPPGPGPGGGGGGTDPSPEPSEDPDPSPEPTDDPDDPDPSPEPSEDPDDPDPSPSPTGPQGSDDPEPTPPNPGGGDEGDDPGGGGEGDDPDDEEEKPVLPLTGVERRPIWILLGLGAAFVIAGVLQLTVRRRAHE